MKEIHATEIELNLCGKEITCFVEGYYYPASKGSDCEPPEAEEFDLILKTDKGIDITEILNIESVFEEVIKNL